MYSAARQSTLSLPHRVRPACAKLTLSTAKPLRPTPGAAVGPARALVEEHGWAAQELQVMARAAIVDGLEGGRGPPWLPVALQGGEDDERGLQTG